MLSLAVLSSHLIETGLRLEKEIQKIIEIIKKEV